MPYSRLDIVKPGQRQYRIFDSLPKQLESDLKLECDLIMTERPNMCVLGVQYLCSDAIFRALCDRADSIMCG